MWRLRLGAKTSVYLLTASGVGAFTYHSLVSVNALDLPPSFLNGIVRSSRALFTITSCVLDYKYSLYGLPADSDEYGRALSEIHLRSARRILNLCDANKGFYIKAGQFVAAVRQVPREYSSTLSSLQDQAVPCSFKAVREVIVKNLGKDLSEIFLSFDEQPIAAASIAQVHHAVLKDHQEVAIKVQYPGLEYQMKFDLATMAFLSRSVSLLFPEYRFEWMVSEFRKSIACELDFIQEAKNSERAANNFKKNGIVRIPFVYWDFTSRQVLTMEFCEGHKVDDLEFLNRRGISSIEVAKALVDAFAEMIFVHGFLHGDPHPGNVLVSPQGSNGFSLVILDHGIYKQLSEDFRKNYCDLWEALIRLDSQKYSSWVKTSVLGSMPDISLLYLLEEPLTALGRGMSLEEKKHLKEELKSLKMEDISSFMESLPPDFLTILRTDGLLRSLVSKLGAPQRIRLLTYARCALRGLSPEASSGSEIMEFVAFLDEIRRSFALKLRKVWLLAGDHIWVYAPFSYQQVKSILQG